MSRASASAAGCLVAGGHVRRPAGARATSFSWRSSHSGRSTTVGVGHLVAHRPLAPQVLVALERGGHAGRDVGHVGQGACGARGRASAPASSTHGSTMARCASAGSVVVAERPVKRSMSSDTVQPCCSVSSSPSRPMASAPAACRRKCQVKHSSMKRELLLEAGRHLLCGQRAQIAGQVAAAALQQRRPPSRPPTPRPPGPSQSVTSAACAAARRWRNVGAVRHSTGMSQRGVGFRTAPRGAPRRCRSDRRAHGSAKPSSSTPDLRHEPAEDVALHRREQRGGPAGDRGREVRRRRASTPGRRSLRSPTDGNGSQRGGRAGRPGLLRTRTGSGSRARRCRCAVGPRACRTGWRP